MDPFNAFDLRSFKIIEILGTSSEIKKHCMGWLISANKKYKIIKKFIFLILKHLLKTKKWKIVLNRFFLIFKLYLAT